MSETKESLDRLRAKRGGHRGVSTKLVKESEELVKSQDDGDVGRCEIIKGLLQEKLKILNDIDDEILELCSVDDIEREIEESAEVVVRILHAIKKIEGVTQGQSRSQSATGSNDVIPIQTIDSVTASTNATSVNVSDNVNSDSGNVNTSNTSINTSVNTSNTSVVNTSVMSCKAKLPKLSLVKFKGQITKWNTFWDSFESAIHNNQDISKVDKFNYLNSVLEGPALRAIQGLTLTGANYDAAIDILKDRFGRTQQIITAHMDELLKISGCTGDRLTSLRFVYDKIRAHVRGLATLGVSSEQYGSLLIPIIMSKMPNDIRLEIARKAKNDVWQIEELLDTIKLEVEAREVCETTKTTEKGPHDRSKDGVNPQATPTAKGLLVGTKDGEVEQRPNANTGAGHFKIQCAFCNERHYSASCDKVVTVNERKAILKKAGRCFRCLYRGHNARDCKGPRNCRHCNRQHHQSICMEHESKTRAPEQGRETDPKKQDGTPEVTATAPTRTNERRVLLQTARATVENSDGSRSASAKILFDSGSQRSYVTDNLRAKLGLKPLSNETLRLNTFGDNKYKTQKCQVFNLNFKTCHGEIFPISALNFPVICTPLEAKFDISDYPHLQDLDLADCASEDRQSIDVLIGSDHYWDFITGEVIRGETGPLAIASKFGWILSGPATTIAGAENEREVVSNLIISEGIEFDPARGTMDEITHELKRFWDVEAIGICDKATGESLTMSSELSPDIVFNGQRYEVSLPWRQDCLPLSDNYESCNGRLLSLHRKLSKQPKLLNEYDKIIRDQLDAGIVERVPENDKGRDSVGTHYSPHHPVIRQDKDTTKIRIVYDGSAKPESQERSLNDCLEIGPNFIPHLFDMLIRFRSNPIALTADIEKAFLMVGIKADHKDMLRFLWFDDPLSDDPATIILRFNRLMFGLRPSPSILGSVIQHHLDSYKKSEPEMAELLSKSFYVDDLLAGEKSVSKAFEIYEKSKKIMAAGGFNLRKWNSNSQEVIKRIEQVESKGDHRVEPATSREEDESYAKSTTNQESVNPANVVKLLGVGWDTSSDTISFNFDELQAYAISLALTKRSLLKLVAKIFDPLGLLTPFTVTFKIMFQILCQHQVDWDQELDGELKLKFITIRDEIIHLNAIEVPRYYFCSDTSLVEIQLHGFSDASRQAYAAVVYLRSVDGEGRVRVSLVASKSRVAPTKQQSIPRLELLGAVILARLTKKVKDILGDIDTVHWVDSTAALCWIKNDRAWRQYVRNRVMEIRSLTSIESWRFCPGIENPADLPSRGLEAKELVSNETWWNGPKFLHHSPDTWPNNAMAQGSAITDDAALEMAKRQPVVIHSLTANEATLEDNDIGNIIDVERYSS